MALKQGTQGNNILHGTAAADQMFGYGGNDNLLAYEGDDQLWGGAGNDSLSGGTGDDWYRQLVGRRTQRVECCRSYAAAALPVISAQSSKALVRAAR